MSRRRRVVLLGGLLGLFALVGIALRVLPVLQRQSDHRRVAALGYASVAPGGRYFQRGDGRPLILIGQNDAITWPDMRQLWDRVNPETTEAFFQMMQEHGVNVTRIMAEYVQYTGTYLEDPVGTFNPSAKQYWDDFFALARKYEIYVLLTPWDTFWMYKEWEKNPWNEANGGPVKNYRDFLTKPEVIEAQKNRFKWLIDNYGDEEMLLAWELMNEIDMWWGAFDHDIVKWIDEMAAFVRAYEQERWGKNHMITVSVAKAEPHGALAQAIYNHPLLDFATTHLYYEPTVNAPSDTVTPAWSVNDGVKYALKQIKDRRPYTDTETGPISRWISEGDFDTEYFHNMSWAHLASGGAGIGMRWPYRQPHTLSADQRLVQKAIATFVDTFPFAGFSPDNIEHDLRMSEEQWRHLTIMGIGDRQTALLWVLKNVGAPNAVTDATLWIRNWQDGAYEITFWDTRAAAAIESIPLTATGGELAIPLPPMQQDLAIIVRSK